MATKTRERSQRSPSHVRDLPQTVRGIVSAGTAILPTILGVDRRSLERLWLPSNYIADSKHSALNSIVVIAGALGPSAVYDDRLISSMYRKYRQEIEGHLPRRSEVFLAKTPFHSRRLAIVATGILSDTRQVRILAGAEGIMERGALMGLIAETMATSSLLELGLLADILDSLTTIRENLLRPADKRALEPMLPRYLREMGVRAEYAGWGRYRIVHDAFSFELDVYDVAMIMVERRTTLLPAISLAVYSALREQGIRVVPKLGSREPDYEMPPRRPLEAGLVYKPAGRGVFDVLYPIRRRVKGEDIVRLALEHDADPRYVTGDVRGHLSPGVLAEAGGRRIVLDLEGGSYSAYIESGSGNRTRLRVDSWTRYDVALELLRRYLVLGEEGVEELVERLGYRFEWPLLRLLRMVARAIPKRDYDMVRGVSARNGKASLYLMGGTVFSIQPAGTVPRDAVVPPSKVAVRAAGGLEVPLSRFPRALLRPDQELVGPLGRVYPTTYAAPVMRIMGIPDGVKLSMDYEEVVVGLLYERKGVYVEIAEKLDYY